MNNYKKQEKCSLLFCFYFLVQGFNGAIAIASEDNNLGNESAPEVAYHVKIIPDGDSSIQQLILTEEIYQHSKKNNLNDFTVVDSLGEVIPFEISRIDNRVVYHNRNTIIYPLSETHHLLEKTSFKYDQKNRLSEIQSNNFAMNKNQVVGYLLDLGSARALKKSRLNFMLSEIVKTSFLRFDIDQSNDLKQWYSISKGEVLAQLFHQQAISQHNHIDISDIKYRYLRIKLLDQVPAFSILSVTHEYSEEKKEQIAWGEQKDILYNQSEQGFVMKLSPSLSYKMLKIELPSAGSLLKGRLYSKTNNQSRWIARKDFNFFHLKDGNSIIVKDTLSLSRLVASQIKISLGFPVSGLQSEPLKAKLAWVPQKLIFLANGNSPYKLIVGDHSFLKIPISRQPILSMIKNQINGKMATATFGKSKLVEIKKAIKEEELNWQKLGLWLILIIGVLLMAWMAKRLIKQLDTPS